MWVCAWKVPLARFRLCFISVGRRFLSSALQNGQHFTSGCLPLTFAIVRDSSTHPGSDGRKIRMIHSQIERGSLTRSFRVAWSLAHCFSSSRRSFRSSRWFSSHSTVPGCMPSPNLMGLHNCQLHPYFQQDVQEGSVVDERLLLHFNRDDLC